MPEHSQTAAVKQPSTSSLPSTGTPSASWCSHRLLEVRCRYGHHGKQDDTLPQIEWFNHRVRSATEEATPLESILSRWTSVFGSCVIG